MKKLEKPPAINGHGGARAGSGRKPFVATAAARLVLVEGLTVSRAARQVGIAQPTAYKAVKRVEAAYVKAVVLNEELR